MTNSMRPIMWMQAIGIVLAACAVPPRRNIGTSHSDLAKWIAGPGQHVAVRQLLLQVFRQEEESVTRTEYRRLTSPDGLTTIPSNFGPDETLGRLVAEIKARRAEVVARIDHSAGADRIGMPLRPTDLVNFGNPRSGTPLMRAARTVGTDLSLRGLVRQDGYGRTWLSYNQPAWLAARHNIADGASTAVAVMENVLAAVADAATTGTQGGDAPTIGAKPSSGAAAIRPYFGDRNQEVAASVLGIQNDEAGLGLTIDDQPDLLNIALAYREGGFWVAVDGNERIVGTIGLLRYGRAGVLKSCSWRPASRPERARRAIAAGAARPCASSQPDRHCARYPCPRGALARLLRPARLPAGDRR